MKTFDIWCEGYVATGQSSGARKLRSNVTGEDFKDACSRALGDDPYYDVLTNTYWACRLFDNQVDAIKSFG